MATALIGAMAIPCVAVIVGAVTIRYGWLARICAARATVSRPTDARYSTPWIVAGSYRLISSAAWKLARIVVMAAFWSSVNVVLAW